MGPDIRGFLDIFTEALLCGFELLASIVALVERGEGASKRERVDMCVEG